MAITYGDSTLPGDEVTVRERETTAVSRGFTASVALVGGYDASNGSVATADVGTAIEVSGGSDAATKFGDGSELHRQTQLAFANGADTVYCVPVSETTGTTQSFAGTSSGSLDDAPIFDPTVNTEHSISAQDTVEGSSVTVNTVYADTPSQPSDANTMNLNPVNGEWAADESSDYDITYDHGTYDSGAITAAAQTDARIVAVLSENESLGSTLETEVQARAVDFNFKHGVVGAGPEVGDPANYSDGIESPWQVVCPHPRGTFDNSDEPEVRTLGALAGAFAGTELTASTTNEALNLLTDLRTVHTKSELATFGDSEYDPSDNDIEGVTPLIKRDATTVEIVEDLTSDPDGEFRSLYKHEIVNDLSYSIHLVARAFVSVPNTTEGRTQDLLVPTKNLLDSAASQTPPMLNNEGGDGKPYSVSVDVGSSDDTATMTVGLDPLSVAKHVTVEINVGDVITFGGASA